MIGALTIAGFGMRFRFLSPHWQRNRIVVLGLYLHVGRSRPSLRWEWTR